MFSIVCCPKPFNSDFSMIQSNAIQSWLRLPGLEKVIVVGDEQGTKDYVRSLNDSRVIFHPNVTRNEWNTPLVNSIFEIGWSYTTAELLCYVNADIILLDSFSQTLKAWMQCKQNPKSNSVLMVGLRWDWKQPEPVDFNRVDWQQHIVNKAKGNGEMHACSGMDYFVHTRSTFPVIFPFAIGRYFWDWWLVGNCFKRGIPTVDVSETVFAIHQDSPWFQNGKTVVNRRQMYQTEEVKRNHSFDNYGRHINNGTNQKSQWDGDRIVFVTK